MSEPSDDLQTATAVCLVESRMLYVGTEERMLLYEMFLLYMKKLFAESILCNSKGIAPTRPSDVKALTRES